MRIATLATHFFAQSHRARIDQATVPAVSTQMQAAQTAAPRDALDELSEAERAELEAGEHQPLVLTRAEFDPLRTHQRSGLPGQSISRRRVAIFEASRKRYEYPALHLMQLLNAFPAPWSGKRNPPMPTIWPNLSVKVYEQMSSHELQPPKDPSDTSKTTPGNT